MSSATPATLDEIEDRLRSQPLEQRNDAIEPTPRGRPPELRQQVIERILALGAEACGGRWDKSVAWKPIRSQLKDEGFCNDTIRRAAQDAGVRLHPPRGKTRAHPPKAYKPEVRVMDGPEDGPAVTIEAGPTKRSQNGKHAVRPEVDLDAWIDAGCPADVLKADRPAGLNQDVRSPCPHVFIDGVCDYCGTDERLTHLIGLAPLRPSALRKIVTAGAKTVAEALRLDLDALVGADQADLMRAYARGE